MHRGSRWGLYCRLPGNAPSLSVATGMSFGSARRCHLRRSSSSARSRSDADHRLIGQASNHVVWAQWSDFIAVSMNGLSGVAVGVDLTLSAVVEFESFLDDLDEWVESSDDEHRLAYLINKVANGMDLDDPPEPARRMYHPRLFQYVRLLADASPSPLMRSAEIGRRLERVSALLDRAIDGAPGKVILYGERCFGGTGQVTDGARYTSPARCAQFAAALNGLDVTALLADERAVGPESAEYVEWNLEILRRFYNSVAAHGEGAIGIYT